MDGASGGASGQVGTGVAGALILRRGPRVRASVCCVGLGWMGKLCKVAVFSIIGIGAFALLGKVCLIL
jgi:hypothetical protein